MTKPLDLERFKELLAAYGGKPERFPEREREAAFALLERSEEARALFAAESALDEVFAVAPAPELSSSLARKLAELPIRHPHAERRSRFAGLFTALGWAAAAAVGVIWGAHSEALDGAESGDTAETSTSSAASEDPLDDDAELVELALGEVTQLEEEP
jgi:ferric-dicitrate binding protein FerR (iron transport regulator)